MRSKKHSSTIFLVVVMLFSMLLTGCKKEDEEPYQVVTDIDGNNYLTVKIGNQVWMAENLRTTRYRNGDSIYHMTGNVRWAQTGLGAWCNYENNPANDKIYGKLYNGPAIMDSRNIAPEGWHVPSADELWALNVYVSAHPGTSISLAKALAGNSHWYMSSKENTPGYDLKTNNASGFNALPGGLRRMDGIFGYDSIEKEGYWWSTDNMVWNLNYENTDVNLFFENYKGFGYSVRCIKD